MQATLTGYVPRSEWRWVMFTSICLVVFSVLPFVFLALFDTQDGALAFMGTLHHPQDGAAQLARIEQGMRGDWLVGFQHSPEAHASALIQPLYTLLGHVARLTGASQWVAFHVARMLVAFIMYSTLYHLASVIWVKRRTRRIFFVLASLGSSFGWFFSLVSNDTLSADMWLAQAFPFYATLVNIHFSLAIAALTMLVSLAVGVLRPGEKVMPSVANGGAVAVLSAVTLAFVYPAPILPLGLAYALAWAVQVIQQRRWAQIEAMWGAWLFIPSLPVLAYDALSYAANPVLAEVIQQARDVVSPLALLLGFGLPLGLALPSLQRAFRRWEADGDRLMLLWLLVMVAMFYGVLPSQRAFLTAAMLPIAYFATRATEDVWLPRIRRNLRNMSFVMGVVVVGISPLFVLILPTLPFIYGGATDAAIETDYVAAFQWLAPRLQSEEVILAAPGPSLWMPSYTGARVVYGHPVETAGAAQKEAFVRQWYRISEPSQCPDLRDVWVTRWGAYRITLVVYGPQEQALGPAACRDSLRLVASFGRVSIYQP